MFGTIAHGHIGATMRYLQEPGLVQVWYPYPEKNRYWHEACRTVWHWASSSFRGADLIIIHGS